MPPIDELEEEQLAPFPAIKKHSLMLTTTQLVHLRDLLSVCPSPNVPRTVSQIMAENEQRPIAELQLWSKVEMLCGDAGVPLGDDAPDFMMVMIRPPELTVLRVEQEQDGFDIDE